MQAELHPHRSTRFLLLYALAYAGGFVAYVPLLTLLLPIKVDEMGGIGRVELLSIATLAGAVSASLANVGFGALSDRLHAARGTRRPWVVAGLLATLGTYLLLHLAQSPFVLVMGVVAFQLALNMMLSPLAAIAADEVPDSQKGMLGGLLAAGPPLGALAGIAVTAPVIAGEAAQLALIGLLVIAMVAPLLIVGRERRDVVDNIAAPPEVRAIQRVDLALMWVARLAVQIAGNVLFTYLFFYFQSVPTGRGEPPSPAQVALISGITTLAALPLALVIGRFSDRIGARKPFLAGTAAAMTIGLLVMALLPSWAAAVAGYALFGSAVAIFLALHSVYAMQLLPSPKHRGRDLGLVNLTNTLPSILSPLLAIWLVAGQSFSRLLLTLAALTAVGGILVLLVRSER